MKKIIRTMSLLICISSIANAEVTNVESFTKKNNLVPCDKEEILEAEFLSFNKALRDANRIGKDEYYFTTFYFSDGSEYAQPSSLECFIQGIDCNTMQRIRSVEISSKTIFEIIRNNSEITKGVRGFSLPMGYGHASATTTVGNLDIEVEAVAGKSSKLSRISENFSRNYFTDFARKYNATFYCRN